MNPARIAAATSFSSVLVARSEMSDECCAIVDSALVMRPDTELIELALEMMLASCAFSVVSTMFSVMSEPFFNASTAFSVIVPVA